MGVIVIVLTWPVTVMTDVIGVGVHVDSMEELEVVDVDEVEEGVLGGAVDVIDSGIGTGTKCVDALAGVEVVVVSVVGSMVGSMVGSVVGSVVVEGV